MNAARVERKALAAHLRVSVQAVGQVLTGKTKALDAANHIRASLYLRCDPLWLATGHGQRSITTNGFMASERTAVYEIGGQWPFRTISRELITGLTLNQLDRLERTMTARIAELQDDLRHDRSAHANAA